MSARFVQPVLLAAVFFGPLVLAAVAYVGPWDWAPRTPHGQLIEPPVQLPAGQLAAALQPSSATDRGQGRWLLLYLRTSPCRDVCIEHFVRLHQVRLALAEDRSRVQIAVLVPETNVPLPPGARRLTAPPGEAGNEEMLALLGKARIRDGRIFVADPYGRLVISYPPDAPRKELLDDLQNLLRLTTIG